MSNNIEDMMNQAIAQYRHSMERTVKQALEQQKQMNDENGWETTEEDRQGLIDEYAKQMEQYEAMMQQQMQVQAQLQNSFENGTEPDMEQVAALQAQLMGMADDDDDDDDDEMDEEALQQFLQENAVPGQYRKYIPIGALLIGTHGEPYETLRLIQDADYTSDVLEGGWGIEDKGEALEMLESLLGGRHANSFADDFAAAKAGNFENMSEEDVEDYQTSVEAITEVLELPASIIENCKTLYAWDLERIGYLVRLFVNIEYLNEAEAWDWMQKAAVKIKENFSSWEEYIVSVLLGRGFAMGVHQEPYAVALDLLTENRAFLDASPISELA